MTPTPNNTHAPRPPTTPTPPDPDNIHTPRPLTILTAPDPQYLQPKNPNTYTPRTSTTRMPSTPKNTYTQDPPKHLRPQTPKGTHSLNPKRCPHLQISNAVLQEARGTGTVTSVDIHLQPISKQESVTKVELADGKVKFEPPPGAFQEERGRFLPPQPFKQKDWGGVCRLLTWALDFGYLTQDMIDDYEPALMFSIPRLAIVCGLVVYADGPLNLDRKVEDMSELFRPFHTLLRKIRDLLQTLTEEELHTLERNLCISQDVEFPIRADVPGPAALAPALSAPLPPEGPLSAKAKDPDAELACSMQYDDQELEQLSRMVHRAGDEMSSLLSPPSACQSPAHRPGPEGSPGREASPGRVRLRSGSDEEDRVFFMDDVEGSAEAPARPESPGGRFGWAGSAQADRQEKGQGGPGGAAGVDMAASEKEQDLTNNNHPEAQGAGKASLAGSSSCSCLDSRLRLDGWEAGADHAETAEMIAHRTGGMKLSATVIFNPKSPSSSDSAVATQETASEPMAGGVDGGPHKLSAAATNCLLHSCVCCGSCGDSREDMVERLQKCSPGGVIGTSYAAGLAKASDGAAEGQGEAPPPADDASDGQEPQAPTSNKCLPPTSGSQVDTANGPPGEARAAGQPEPEARELDAGSPLAQEAPQPLLGSR
ncbi:lateral signaling target protein 2 homolog [Cebus imitator]|uniref:lateral signaling target protein 2 homolog n=1 Tax=Cebus imitator TaxID=2715852 RepID=UPI0018984C98|nr:lateral signaling target protein 2 homolog [Cebus imitator]